MSVHPGRVEAGQGEPVFFGRGDGAERQVGAGGEQESFAAAGRGDQRRLCGRQTESCLDTVDRLRGLAHHDLGGGVVDDGAAQLGGGDVLGVLGDHREPGIPLAR
ncbi:hypothetical protein GCM10029992_36730 [Glycomyces albus]